MATNKERDAATGQFQKGHKKLGGRPKGAKDTRPRLNISLRSAMQLFVDEDGNLVAEALREGLKDADGRVKVAAVKVALEFHLKSGGARPPGKGLVIVLSSNRDPLAEKSGRPSPVIDLTMSGPVAAAEPRASDTGARAKPPAPAATAKALPPGPRATTAAVLAGPRKSTPEVVAKYVDDSGRIDAKTWGGRCPCCRRAGLTWVTGADGGAAGFYCLHGCRPADIVAALKQRATAVAAAKRAQPAPVPRLPKALQSDGEDMVCTSDDEPQFLLEMPGDD